MTRRLDPQGNVPSGIETTDSPLTGSPQAVVLSDATSQPAAVAVGEVSAQPSPETLMQSSDAARDFVRPTSSHPTPPHTVQAMLSERVHALSEFFGGGTWQDLPAPSAAENNSRGAVTTTTTPAHADPDLVC